MKTMNIKLLSFFLSSTLTVLFIFGYYQFQKFNFFEEKLIENEKTTAVVSQDNLEKSSKKIKEVDKISNHSPEIDIIRVNPSGDFVIAGSGKPQSKINLNNQGGIVLSTDVDEKGNWVLVSEKPLDEGNQMLVVDQLNTDGTKISSKEIIVTKISKDRNLKPVVFGLPNEQGGILKIIQKPETNINIDSEPDVSLSLSEGANGVSSGPGFKVFGIFFDEIGRVSITGMANYGNSVEIFINKKKEGHYFLNSNKEWTIKSKSSLNFGQHLLKANLIDNQGEKINKISIPFLRAEIPKGVLPEDYVIIKPGDMLWTISYRVYGNPWKYVEIYDENKDQISNPDLIFPGQIFTLPN